MLRKTRVVGSGTSPVGTLTCLSQAPVGPRGPLKFPGAASHFCTARLSQRQARTHPCRAKTRGLYQELLLGTTSGLNVGFHRRKQRASEHGSSRPASRSCSEKLGGASGQALVPLLARRQALFRTGRPQTGRGGALLPCADCKGSLPRHRMTCILYTSRKPCVLFPKRPVCR